VSRNDFLGEFEQIVLLAVARLNGDSYGVAIRQEIEGHVGRPVAIGSVYAALDRMERKGYLTSEVGDPTPVRGGRAKRYYTLQSPGAEALRESRDLLDGLWAGLHIDPETFA
jgi:PadR family transcriptional regulator PadR